MSPFHWILLLTLACPQLARSDDRPGSAFSRFSMMDGEGRPLDVVATLPGIARPVKQVTLSAPHDGVLWQMRAHEGQTVERGHLLAVMDNRIELARVRLAEAVDLRTATIVRAETELELAENLLARLLKVGAKHAVSELEIDQARGKRDQAKASLLQAHEQDLESELNLDLARAQLEARNVRAPFAGVVLRVDGREGESVTSDDDLVTLANVTRLRADLHLPVEWYGRLEMGGTYQLAASMPVQRALSATLVSSEPVIDAATQTFRCVFEIDNDPLNLPAGFAVRLIRPEPSVVQSVIN